MWKVTDNENITGYAQSNYVMIQMSFTTINIEISSILLFTVSAAITALSQKEYKADMLASEILINLY